MSSAERFRESGFSSRLRASNLMNFLGIVIVFPVTAPNSLQPQMNTDETQIQKMRLLQSTLCRPKTEVVVDLEGGSNNCFRDLLMRKWSFVFRFEFEHRLSV